MERKRPKTAFYPFYSAKVLEDSAGASEEFPPGLENLYGYYIIKVRKNQTNVFRKMLTKFLWNIQGIFTAS